MKTIIIYLYLTLFSSIMIMKMISLKPYLHVKVQTIFHKIFSFRKASHFALSGSDIIDKESKICIPSGLCAVYKPKDVTSNDVVMKIKYILQDELRKQTGNKKLKIKIGHGGTLDPLAEGVLVLGIGSGNLR